MSISPNFGVGWPLISKPVCRKDDATGRGSGIERYHWGGEHCGICRIPASIPVNLSTSVWLRAKGITIIGSQDISKASTTGAIAVASDPELE